MRGPGPDRFHATLARGPLLLDAAMGTRLIALGLDLASDDPAVWNLARPDDVLDLHGRDIAAGADALLSNTFGANPVALSRLVRPYDAADLNRRAVSLAREAAGPDRFVIGSLGPTAVDRPEVYREQAEVLAVAGVDALILETHTYPQARLGLARLRHLTPLPILVSLHAWPGSPRSAARRLVQLGATAIGSNCQPGMGPMLGLVEGLRRATDAPLLVKPSAGLPGAPPASPESFAAAVPRLIAQGVRLFGGCCGTTEAHVAALRAALETAACP